MERRSSLQWSYAGTIKFRLMGTVAEYDREQPGKKGKRGKGQGTA